MTLQKGSLVWGTEEEWSERKSLLLAQLNINYFLSDEIYLGYSAASPGKQLDHLASWPPQRQPWCSQKTSIRQLLAGPDENN